MDSVYKVDYRGAAASKKIRKFKIIVFAAKPDR